VGIVAPTTLFRDALAGRLPNCEVEVLGLLELVDGQLHLLLDRPSDLNIRYHLFKGVPDRADEWSGRGEI
jgi:hypothetical protein